jgi:acyl-CoA reductase-like NAD-dependent aldehyde dehydrogenase
MWGRCLNAGQTCIAAEYVLCHQKVADAFAQACVAVLQEFFGSDGAATANNLSRIVAERHYNRLVDMLQRSKGTVVAGGLDQCSRSSLMFAPTVVTGVKAGDSLLAEEIFGIIQNSKVCSS